MKSMKSGGRFGSTQSTVLSLKALVRYSQVYKGIKGSGNFVVYLNGQKVKTQPFDEKEDMEMKKLDFSKDVYESFTKLYPNSCASS